MNNFYPTTFADNRNNASPLVGKGKSAGLVEGELQGKWLPVLLLCLYFLSFWNFGQLPIPEMRWYIFLGMGILACLFQNTQVDWRAFRLFWVVYGLSFMGAVFSLWRATDIDLCLWNTAAMGINFIATLLFLPVLSTRNGRRILLIFLIGAAFLWIFFIHSLLTVNQVMVYTTLKDESQTDKNQIGFLFALASCALFYLAVFYKPAKRFNKIWPLLMRLSFAFGGTFCLFYQTMIYARSGILTTFVSIGAILIIKLIRSPRKLSLVLLSVLFALVAGLCVVLIIVPKIQTMAPGWDKIYHKTEGKGVDAYGGRLMLLQKGMSLIMDNPLIGVGVGGSRASLLSSEGYFPNYLIHNTFLSEWAEKGFLGLIANIIFVLAYWKILKKQFFSVALADQIWLLLFIALFFEMNFKEVNSVTFFMLGILSGIAYDQNKRRLRKQVPRLSRNMAM